MLKKTVEYLDFDGKERSETLYFNLNEPEIVRLDVQFEGGLEAHVENLSEDKPEDILSLFETVIRESYGEKSEDGRHFLKNPERTEEFYHSAAYSALFVELIQDADAASDFFTSVLSRSTLGGEEVGE